MSSADIGLYIEPDLVIMVPITKRAVLHFRQKFDMPKDCDGLDVTDVGPHAMLDHLPRYFIFKNTKKEPKKTYKRLFL